MSGVKQQQFWSLKKKHVQFHLSSMIYKCDNCFKENKLISVDLKISNYFWRITTSNGRLNECYRKSKNMLLHFWNMASSNYLVDLKISNYFRRITTSNGHLNDCYRKSKIWFYIFWNMASSHWIPIVNIVPQVIISQKDCKYYTTTVFELLYVLSCLFRNKREAPHTAHLLRSQIRRWNYLYK